MPSKVSSLELLNRVHAKGCKTVEIWFQALVILALVRVRNVLIEEGKLHAPQQGSGFEGEGISVELVAEMLYGDASRRSHQNARKAMARVGEHSTVVPGTYHGYWTASWDEFTIDAAAPGASGELLKGCTHAWVAQRWVQELIFCFGGSSLLTKQKPTPLRAEKLGIDLSGMSYYVQARVLDCLQGGGRHLSLDSVDLDGLPDWVQKLTQLETLAVRGNNLESLPDWITSFTNLKSLDVSGNNLRALPNCDVNFAPLTSLDISFNSLQSLPNWIASNTQLTRLNLGSNYLRRVPDVVKDLKKLEYLTVGDNSLESLPSWIADLSQLRHLGLDNNNLESLPPEMRHLVQLDSLDIGYNKFQSLPEWLVDLSNLKVLSVHDNPLDLPTEVLVTSKPELILEALFAKRMPLNAVKITLVGQSDAGKTSVSHYLRTGKPHPNPKKTVKIEIEHWAITCPERTVDAHVWDFGGQEMMHATHQLFLRDRSLFLYVFHSRDDEASNRLHYWMETIRTVAAKAPIIIVCNHADQHERDLNQSEIIEFYGPEVFFAKTDAKNGDGIDELRETIVDLVAGMAMVTDELPVSWINVRDEIAADGRDTISYDDYVNICSAKKVNPETEDGLLDILDKLGVALRYDNNGTFVLKPQWITEAIYAIILARADQHDDAKVSVTKLGAILADASKYPTQKHGFIIDMMDKFDLCHKLPQRDPKHLFVPSLATANEPGLQSWRGHARMVFQYKALRPGILHRVMVRAYEYLDGPSYWQTGADFNVNGATIRLRKPGGSESLELYAKGDSEEKMVNALTKIRDLVRNANAEYENLRVREFVVADGFRLDCGAYFDDLCNWEQAGATETLVSGLAKPIDISELLNRVSYSYEDCRTGRERHTRDPELD